jgi:hypothetical protein
MKKSVKTTNNYYKTELIKDTVPFVNYPNSTSNGLRYGQPVGVRSFSSSVSTAAISAVSSDLFDTLGGDVLTLTGSGFSSPVVQMSADQATWTNQTILLSTSTSISFTTTAFAAGSVYLRVAQAGVNSNVLTLEAWNPTVDPNVTLLFDAKSNPYVAGNSQWIPRYSVQPTAKLSSVTTAHPGDGSGGITFDGDQTNEAGLKDDVWGWSYFLGATDGSGNYKPGSSFTVHSSTTTYATTAANYATAPYNAPSVFGNANQGTIGIDNAVIDGVHSVGMHVYGAEGYKTASMPMSSGLHAVVIRWDVNGASSVVQLSLDGQVGGAGYQSMTVNGGSTQIAYLSSLTVGLGYPATSASSQQFKGTLKAAGILKAKASDTFVIKFNKWKKVRFDAA